MEEERKLKALKIFLRIYGILSLIIFVPLFALFIVQSPLLAVGGPLNWIIWNGVVCDGGMCHVPPMLFIIYIVWGVFLLIAAREPRAYLSFLNFTMWANLAHGLLMVVQTAMMMDHYWSKWLTDIPFILILALGIYIWRPTPAKAYQ
jgi:hypothetical protein